MNSINSPNYDGWDYVILTAANESQKKYFELQLKQRLDSGRLPDKPHYAVISDIDNIRIGSGGATINVMRYIMERSSKKTFSGIKILLIHSGGDSKRVPQYSASGKLFAPFPRKINGFVSSLFDELFIQMSGVSTRIKDGMLIAAGDILYFFDPNQFYFYSSGAMALSVKASVREGTSHGVFVKKNEREICRFLHKKSADKLFECGAVDKSGNIDIDTGTVIFNSDLLDSLYSLTATEDRFKKYVNGDVCLDLYGDILYPLASDSTIEEYLAENSEKCLANGLLECRMELFDCLHGYNFFIHSFYPSKFLHFGTTRELLELMKKSILDYGFLGGTTSINTNKKDDHYVAINSYISPDSIIGKGSYIENSIIEAKSVIGENCVVSCSELKAVTIPSETVLHSLPLTDGKYVTGYYSLDDNPKEFFYMGKPTKESLWEAKIFPVCSDISLSVSGTLLNQKSENLISLSECLSAFDPDRIAEWQNYVNDYTVTQKIIKFAEKRLFLSEVTADDSICLSDNIIHNLEDIIQSKAPDCAMRIYFYISCLTDKKKSEIYKDKCFLFLKKIVCANNVCDFFNGAMICKNFATCSLPVRINFSGEWTDTPPICMEQGGCVLNCTVILDNNAKPINASVKKIDELKIIISSEDFGSYCEFTEINELTDCCRLSDPYALVKATLIACEIIPQTPVNSLKEILQRLGGGLYISTNVKNIPFGSGLGTSSILLCACVNAITEILGRKLTDQELYSTVLKAEQILSTGGGWQDQVGGCVAGIKLISSGPGDKQTLNIQQVNISRTVLNELNERFCLVYTGQHRLARNLLRDVIYNYFKGSNQVMYAFSRKREIPRKMKECLENGEIDAFAHYLDENFFLDSIINPNGSNKLSSEVFAAVSDMIEGKMFCGAGGGGFVQMILKKGFTKSDLERRLNDVFGELNIRMYNTEIYLTDL